ncbi:cyclic nucleotide-regulated ABC bacteriocin/lantibiotic exporter [Gloeothece citriformis PCC 7424]|uniref:Cyclic nucleotide-regulated ABC bacteriocin/lantibiotic exporter n=1 Tax=Gloeothece citriformis (strain PCC 7424) TaxID=65393 RepID=B7KGI4_GLOC7|nr:peptidase domain-containing ABC transporter [Gloeothece citriformis]ACK71911.1 cyclic nucleotide-regulated ABC bacteriocin/lantibiotic exporter [Gloeothece citriformis PCC 7424]
MQFSENIKQNQFNIHLLSSFLEINSLTKEQISKFEKDVEIINFKGGETLLNLAESSSNSSSQNIWIVVQGSVRLLAFSPKKQRQVSIQKLTIGDCFGGDDLFYDLVLPYQAVAGESGQIAKLSHENLESWLEQVPSVHQNWSTLVKNRQALIFFKTQTELQNLPSDQLQNLLPYIVEKQIAAGEILSEVTPYQSGRFWLRKGEIYNQPLGIGEAWGYPETVPTEWVSESPLWVYQLPQKDWENARKIAPIFAKGTQNETLSPSKPKIVASNGSSSPKIAPSAVIDPNLEPQKIEFPKPLKRRAGLSIGYPFIEQQSSSDCGAACLAMISQYWGKRFSLNFLRNLAGVGRSGASIKNLAKSAEKLGYQARPVRASLNTLLDQKNPWIAHWQGDHYIVVYRGRSDRLLIADPAVGKRSLSKAEFMAGWTGYALLLDPTEQLKRIPGQKPSLSRFIGLLFPYRSTGLQIILASFLIQIFGLVAPLFTQIILDQVVVNKSLTTLNVFALGVLIFGIWGIILTAVRQYFLSYLSNRLDLTLMSGFIRHTLLLPLRFFEDRHVGDILTRVNENQKIQRFLLNQVVLAWLDFLMGFVYLGLMLYYNWQLTLLIVALIPPILILTLAATPLLRHISREVFNKSADQNSALVETITGIATVKATAAEGELRWRWEDRLTQYLNSRFNSQKLGINLQAASGLINSLGSTALLWYGATLVIQDQLTIGQFVAFNMLIGKVLSPVLSLANLWDELQEVLISVERLDDIFSTAPEEVPGNPMLILPPLKGEVKFEKVSFRYDTDQERNTLENISFEVKAGQTIAIVGRSGSGKSTLVKLLQGLYLPDQGNIWIDGHDIRHVSPQSLRSQLGVVPQDCFLFSGTIVENITLYRPEYTLEQVVEVAKLAEAHGFIQGMPLGYNTKVGERGANLSGGQRQRIAIARALLGNPKILILDEATSSLDTESERRFQENLTSLRRNRTTFIIAHRLSTVHHADCILVLDRGILVEKGTHKELMNKKQLYYHLAQQQLAL